MYAMSEGLNGRLKILLLSSPESECALQLQAALAQQVELVTASSLAECRHLLETSERPAPFTAAGLPELSRQSEPAEAAGYDAFLCDWCYQGGTWKEALELVRRKAPHLPVIVICRTGGEPEWMEVLQAGAFDMVCAPFSTEEVLSTLEHAAALQQERYEWSSVGQFA